MSCWFDKNFPNGCQTNKKNYERETFFVVSTELCLLILQELSELPVWVYVEYRGEYDSRCDVGGVDVSDGVDSGG